MPKVSPIQSNFNGGEISPLVLGRVDTPRYKESLKTCLNYVPLIQGPITRRPGTGFIFPVKDSNAGARLIPFEFSTTQAYALEFGNHYIRFLKNYGIITTTPSGSPINITAITKASPGVVSATAHGLANGYRVTLNGSFGMSELINREFVVANVTANTFTLVDNITSVAVDTTSYTTYTSGGTVGWIYEVGTNYLIGDIPALKFTQSDDVLYLTHPFYAPQKLIRLGDASWTNTTIAFQDGPFYDENIHHGTTLTITNIGGPTPWHIVASSILDINNGAGFRATDIGRLIRIKKGASWMWGTLGAYTSTVSMDFSLPTTDLYNSVASLVPGDVISDWRLGLWSVTDGYPSSVVFHEDRLVFSGAGGDPTRFDSSMTSNYEVMAPTAQDGSVANNNGYSFALASNDVNTIRWSTSDEQGLFFGTTGGEWLVQSSSASLALSPTSVSAKKTTSFGSENVQAVQSGKNTLFVQRGGRKLRELNYYFDVNGFRAADLTQLAEHMTTSTATLQYMAVQKNPQPLVWVVRNDGVLLAMTYERELEALKVGWSRHIMGGNNNITHPNVESVIVIPSSNGKADDVWIIVKRVINGQAVRYIEFITQLFDDTTPIVFSTFLDSSLTYLGSPVSTISGLNYLNGETVSVLGDGSPQPSKVVVNGKITLDTAASIVTVGLTYNSDGQKLRNDAGAADGTAMAKTRRTHRFGIQFLNTLGFSLGPNFTSLDVVTLNDPNDSNFDQVGGLYTGIYTQPVTTDYDFDNTICWRQSQPLPGTILGLYPQMVTQDRG